ncbi:nuclear transport factor 2 family protein [Micromonospora sp. WMMD710]|uniref:nuclear transport factor 2 family protein n=1 Tax=Micromonospora sp. WMMD710 TaxID=3016085 RepID=UPI0024169D09|nr:nuclear transport factor 2 family protein [Micromonospora sp. WMMD710]MDG4757710.1 nuclear transport factor 2 family protein [Micromonospora sp. WMMD710]
MSQADGSFHAVNDTAATRQTAHDDVDRLKYRDWPGPADLLAGDVVYEMPQTRERVRGRDAFLRFTIDYPGDWYIRIRRAVADSRLAALWLDVRVGTRPSPSRTSRGRPGRGR